MANKAEKKRFNLIRLEETVRAGFNFLDRGSIAEGQRAFADALLMIQQQVRF